MSRSLKKGLYVDPRILKKVQKVRDSGKHETIKTWSRACVISPEMVGITFLVHNGKDFINVLVDENMISHRLGEFSPTKKFVRHGGKMAKDQESAAAAKSAAPAKAAAPAGKKK